MDEAERKGQLEVRRWEDAYLREGHFDQDRMLALIEEVLQGGKAQGYPITRLVANIEWALEDRPGVDDIVVLVPVHAPFELPAPEGLDGFHDVLAPLDAVFGTRRPAVYERRS